MICKVKVKYQFLIFFLVFFRAASVAQNFKSICSRRIFATVIYWLSFRLYQFNGNKTEYLSYAPSGKTSHSDTAGSVALTQLQYTPLFMSISVSYIKLYCSWNHDLYQQIYLLHFCDLEWRMFSGLAVCFGCSVFLVSVVFKQPFFSL